jgi:hypothetical protein
MIIKITENQIKEYLNSFMLKGPLDIAVSQLLYILNGHESPEECLQSMLSFCERNNIQ